MKFLKRLVVLFIGIAMLLTACNLPSTPVPDPATATIPPTDTPTEESSPTPESPTTTSTPQIDSPSELASSQWMLASYGENQTTPVEGTEVTLIFQEDSNAGGTGGCNSYGTEYETRDGEINFSPIVSTLIACAEEGVMEQEQGFFTALQEATEYEMTSDQLTIQSTAGLGTLNFVPYEEQIATPTAIVGVLCAIGSPGITADWDLCRSLEYGFEFQYPAEAEIIDHTSNYAWIDLPFTPGTNLTSKYVEVAVTDVDDDICMSPLALGYPPEAINDESVEIGGDTFLSPAGQDAGAGNVYDWEAYSISRGMDCVSFSFVLRSHTPELEPTPPPEFDPDEESLIFTEIVATFEWLELPATPTPAATATPAPTPVPERIRFDTGETSATVSCDLEPSESDLYVLRILGGQTLNADLSFDAGEATLVVWGADGDILLSEQANATTFSGAVPSSQDYYIMVVGNPDAASEYELEINVPPLGVTPQPTLTATLAPVAVRINFSAGETSATVSGSMEASGANLYVLRAEGGQNMVIETVFSRGRAVLSVRGADGTVLQSSDENASEFDGVLPSDQDYFILLEGSPDSETSYTMEVTIPE
jgi:heat shock protein HslJ